MMSRAPFQIPSTGYREFPGGEPMIGYSCIYVVCYLDYMEPFSSLQCQSNALLLALLELDCIAN